MFCEVVLIAIMCVHPQAMALATNDDDHDKSNSWVPISVELCLVAILAAGAPL